MNKPYHERPDWILKSIVYFCDNYTIDGKNLGKLKRRAIEIIKKEQLQGRILGLGHFWTSDPCKNFWDCLYYLHGGEMAWGSSWGPPNIGAKCEPWTEAEKRKIDKMPRVK